MQKSSKTDNYSTEEKCSILKIVARENNVTIQ